MDCCDASECVELGGVEDIEPGRFSDHILVIAHLERYHRQRPSSLLDRKLQVVVPHDANGAGGFDAT